MQDTLETVRRVLSRVGRSKYDPEAPPEPEPERATAEVLAAFGPIPA